MTALTGWTASTIGKVLELRYGRALGKEQRHEEGRYPVVGSAGKMSRTDIPLVAESIIVIGRKGTIGRAQYLHEGGWPSDTTYFTRLPPGIDARFLLHQLESLGLERLDSSTATPSLRRQDLERQLIRFPSPQEQRQIVDILEGHLSRLSAADAGLALATTRLQSWREAIIAAGLLGQAIPESRERSTLDAAGTLDGVLADLPAGWSWRRLGEVADVAGGITKDSKRQSDSDFVEVPYLRVANVQRGRLDLSTVSRIRASPQKAAALRLMPGDVLMNEGGDRDKLARGWVWEGQIDDCIHQNHVFRARVRDDLIEPKLLSWAANTMGGRWADRNGKQSVNLASISLSKIRQMPVPVPPRHAQKAVVAFVEGHLDAADQLTAGLAAQRARSASLRRAVLSAAFSGRLTGRPTDVEEFAASSEDPRTSGARSHLPPAP